MFFPRDTYGSAVLQLVVDGAVDDLAQPFSFHPLDQQQCVPAQSAVATVYLLADGVSLVDRPVLQT